MAGIFTEVDTDIQKLQRLNSEIRNIKKQLSGIDVKVDIDIKAGLESELKKITQEYQALAEKVVQVESSIERSTQNIKKATDKIIDIQSKISSKPATASNDLSVFNDKEIKEATKAIEGQAKSYDELKDLINGVLGTRKQNLEIMAEEQSAIIRINKELSFINRFASRYEGLSKKQKDRVVELNNELIVRKNILSEIRQIVNNDVRLNISASSSMKEMSQSLAKMRMTFRELNEEERNSNFGKTLLASIQQADAKIKELDATIGNHQRNVGNYAGQWNGLNMSVQQLARELPALAYGPKVFFSAISNNLPILSDEIKKAKNQYKALTAQGQKATPVWRQVLSSMFSWQSAMAVGITLLTLYGHKIASWVVELVKGKKAISETYSSLEEFHKSVGSSSGKAIMQVEKLSKAWKALSTEAQKTEFLSKYRKEIDETTLAINNISEAENAFVKNKGAVVKAIMDRAWAMAGQNVVTKEFEKAQEDLAKIRDDKKKGPSIIHSFITSSVRTPGVYYSPKDIFNEEIEEREAEVRKRISNAISLSTDMSKIYDETTKEMEEKGIKFVKDGSEIVVNSIEDLENRIREEREKQKTAKTKSEFDVYENEIKRIQEKIDAIKGSRAVDANNISSQSDKVLSVIGKNSLARKRFEKDLEFSIWQSRIDAMEEGADRTIEQMKLSHAKEVDELDREQEDFLKKKIEMAREEHEAGEVVRKLKMGKSYKRSSFDELSVALTSEELEMFNSRRSNIAIKQSKEWYSSLVKEYQSYTDKRVEIERKFNEDIEQLRQQRVNAEDSGDAEMVQMLSRSIAKATSDKGKALAEHDFKVLRESPDYSRAFDDLKTTSSETLRTLIAELERYKAQASSSLNPADLKVYTDAIRQMYDELDSRNPFEALARNMEELSKAESNLRQAKKTLEDVRNGIKIGNGISQDKATGKTKVSYLSEEEALKRVNASMDEYLRLFALADKSRKTAVEQVKQLGASLSQLGGTIGGIQGEILGFVGDFTSFIASSVDGIKTIGKTGLDAMSAVEKASIILSIISSAIQIMKKLSDFIPDAHDQYKKIEEKERAIAKLTSAVNDYKRAVIEARHEDENWFSGDKLKGLEDSAELYNNAREAYEKKLSEKQTAYVDEGVKSWLGKDITNDFILEMMAKKRAGDGSARANLRIETRKKSNGFLGTGIGGHNQETANLEEWVRKNIGAELFDKDNNINRKLVKEILDKFGDKLVGQTKDTLEELDKLQEQIDRHQEVLRNYVVESYSPLIDDMTDGIIEWLDTGKDALDSFRDHAGETFRAIKRDLIKSLVATAIFGTGEDSFQNKIAKLYGLKAKGEITKEEMSRKIAELTKELQDKTAKELPAIKELSDAVDNALSKVGIDVSGKDKLTQDSTKRGFETMTQEQAGELNGRFTTLVVLGEETKNLHTLTNDWLSKIYAKLPNKDLPDIGEQNKSIISSGRIGVQVVFPEDKLNNIVLEIGQLRASVMDMQRLHSETLIETREISDASSALVRQGKEIASNTDTIKRNTSKL